MSKPPRRIGNPIPVPSNNPEFTPILRVKRKRTQDPVDAFVVQTKRVKVDVPTLFTLAQTVETETTDWSNIKLERKIAQPKSKRQDVNFKVVKNQIFDDVKVYDVVQEDPMEDDEIMCNFLPMVKEYLQVNDSVTNSDVQETEYVYDIYMGTTSSQPLGLWANLQWKEEEVYYSGDDTSEYDTEDSNAEDFYANDYPDESSSEYSQHVQSSESDSDW